MLQNTPKGVVDRSPLSLRPFLCRAAVVEWGMASRRRSSSRRTPPPRTGSNGQTQPPASPTTTPTIVRPLAERIAERRRQLAQLEAQESRAQIKDLIKNHPECKSLAHDLEVIRKARVVFADWGHDDILDSVDSVFVQIEDSLKAKVNQLANDEGGEPDAASDLPEMPAPDDAPSDDDDLLAP